MQNSKDAISISLDDKHEADQLLNEIEKIESFILSLENEKGTFTERLVNLRKDFPLFMELRHQLTRCVVDRDT